MHWKRFCLFSLSLAWMAFPARVRAQEAAPVPGYASVEDFSGAMTLGSGGGTYLLFNKQTGKAVGTPNGYSRIGLRHTLYENGPDQVFAEAHGLITDSMRFGMNVGGGYRYLMDDALYGINGWYDQIESQQGHSYQQGGVGLEYLSQPLDVRVNGYVPFGNRENFLNVVDPGTTPVFQGHNFSTLGTALFQQALAGFDTEAGIPVPVVNWLRVYSGFYFLQFEDDKTWGLRARVEGRLTQGVNLSFQVTDDDMFGTNLNVGIDVQLDGRLPTRFGNEGSDGYSRRYEQVRRQWQVQLAHREGDHAVPLNDPADGNPILVTWINNIAGAGGNGTFENPYNVLPTDVDSDYVLVRRGVGNTVGNINLRPGQDLFGEGKQHFINTDRLGLTPIPTTFFANTGNRPTLQAGDLNRPIVTLNDGSIVRGFEMLGGNTAAIGGVGADNFLVECVDVTSASGLVVTGGGQSTIRESNFFNTSPTGVGISVSNTGPTPLNLLIEDVTTEGGAIGTHVRTSNAAGTLNLVDYEGSNHTGTGVLVEANGAAMGVNIADATLTNVGDGFRFDALNGSISGSVTQISATGSGNLFEANINTGALNLNVTDATLSNSTGGSGVSINLVQATGVALFDNLTADGNAVDGAQLTATGAATDFRLDITDSSLVGNVDDAVDSTVLGGANVVVFVDPTAATGSRNNGYEFEVDGANSHLTAIMADTDYSNSGQDGVNGIVTNGGRADLVFDRSPATNSGRNGLNVVVDNSSTLVGVFRDGSFAQSGVGNNGIGINVSVTDNSIGRLTFEDTAADSNGAIGLQYNVAGDSDLSIDFLNGNLSSNPVNNVRGSVDGANSRAIIDFDNTDQNFLSANGSFVTSVTNGGALFATWDNSNVAGSQGDGVRVTGSGAGTEVDLTFNQSLVENNDGNGIIASLTGSPLGSLTVELNDSTVLDNGLDGVNLAIDGAGATGTLLVNNTPITGNARDGVELDVTGGAILNATITGAGNSLSNNGENGLDVRSADNGSLANVNVSDVSINQSGQSGILVVAEQLGRLDLALTNVQVRNNGAHGIESLAATNGQLNIDGTLATITGNQRNGWSFDAMSGGDITASLTDSSLSNNGVGVASSGVLGNVNGVGSTANVAFNNVSANSNTLHGFQFNGSAGGNLIASAIDVTASNNLGDGIRLTGNDAGTRSSLLMFGNSTLDNNQGNGLTVAGADAEQVAVQFAGTVNNNGGDGINVSLTNVNNAAIELSSLVNGTINGNTGDGIEIDLVDTDLVDLTVNGTLVESLRIDGLTITNNGGDGINIHANGSDIGSGVISNNQIRDNNGSGIIVNLENGSGGDLSILNNEITSNDGFGIHVTEDSGISTVIIDGNEVVSNTLGNIIVELNGTASVELHIDNNIVDGDGVTGGDFFTPGLNFLGTSLNETTGSIPPDTMGAVGRDHIVEMINTTFTVYDKNTGTIVQQTTLDNFWLNAGVGTVLDASFDPRIIFDPSTNRWYAASLNAIFGPLGPLPGNDILLAVSATDDPTGVWTAFRFRGDSASLTFNDYVTMGVDGNALYLATINFPAVGNVDVSAYAIPLADLLSANPNIINLTRLEDRNINQYGGVLQPAVSPGSLDPVNPILAAQSGGGTSITRSSLITFGNNTFLSAPFQIPVQPYQPSPQARQPQAPSVENDDSRFISNVVEVNGTLWAAHAVQGSFNNSAIRWYQIDSTTNQVLQSGTIEQNNLDFYYPSVAVNTNGVVVIGYSGSGPNQFISSMASYGVTNGNNTAFQNPVILAPGTANYNLTFGSGRNRWGDYSATVVDPDDPNTFWTFQERVDGLNNWGVQITEINFERIDPIVGTTTGNAIAVTINDNARLRDPSTINGNTVTGHGGDGISVDLNDNGVIESLTIDGNSVSDNGGDGIRVANTGGQTIGDLTITDNISVEGNGGNGIVVRLNDAQGLPDILIDGNTVVDNALGGILLDATNTATGQVDVTNNTVNTNQVGILVNINNTIPALAPIAVNVSANTVGDNVGIGIDIDLSNVEMSLLSVTNNVIEDNGNDGLTLNAIASPITRAEISDNRVLGNLGDEGVFLSFSDSPIGTLSFRRNIVSGAQIDGVRMDFDNSPVGSVEIVGNNVGGGGGGGLSGSIDDSLPLIRAGFNGNLLAGNDDGSTGLVPLGFTADFFGQVFTNTFVNNNGNITFGTPLSTFTPFGLLNTNSQIIAPFFADVDTRGVAPDVTYGNGIVAGRPAFGVNWLGVHHFSVNGAGGGLPPNTFQLVMIDRSDVGTGDFDMEFNYGSVLWETGTASGGNDQGLGGTSATVGYSNGVNASFEFPGSRVNGALLNSGPAATSLVQNSINSAHSGRYIFFARNGNIGTGGGGANSGGDGFALNINNGSDIGAMLIDQNQISNNGFHGIELDVNDSQLPTSVVISNNTISGQSDTGVSIVTPDTNGTDFGLDFTRNTIGNNTGGPGIDLQLDSDAGAVTATFVNNTIEENAEEGINIDLRQTANLMITDFSGNTISDNDSIGVHLDATDSSQFTFTAGATGHNTFDGNVDAGLAITMNSSVAGQISIADSDFLNTTNGGVPTMSGEGILISLTDNAVLQSLTIGDATSGLSNVNENASHGVQILVDGFSQLTNPTIQNLTINENGGDGINIERRGLGVIDNFVIDGNSLSENTGDGFDIQARAGNLTDEYTITNNTIDGSNGRGIAFRVDGDADMTTNLNGNTITNSTGTGITVDSTVNSVTDTPTFTGNWLATTITGNGRGVDINSPGHIIQMGDATAAFPDTIISNNTQEGVLIRSLGTFDLDNVQINNNGADGVLFQGGTGGVLTIDVAEISGNGVGGNGGDGVQLDMTGNTLSVTNARIANNEGNGLNVRSLQGVNNVTLTNNIVTLNTLDGLLLTNDTAGGLTALVSNSQFTSNEQRGVAIFNRGNGVANVTLDDNTVVSNQEEGVYVVNTADADQSVLANATAAMEFGGLVTATPDLVFAMNRNTVSANGLGSAFSATGLVMRVGTADGGLFDHTNNGGFAATRAGVTATVRDNILQGNAGSDVHFESFVSTGNPLASVGTWNGVTFAIAQYQTDPLARLDLIYGGNVADATQATNIGAFYSNDEGIFKSRTTAQTPAGPFLADNRARNAQRLADRNVAPGGLLLNPNVPQIAPAYLYPGMGDSTFRVQLEPGNVFGTGTGFMLDTPSPIVDINDYGGVGALPELFGWGTF